MIGNWIADIFQPIVDFFNWFFWILIGGICAFIQLEYDSIKGLLDLSILNAPFVNEAYDWFMHIAMIVLPLILIIIVLISWMELEIDSSMLKRWFKSLFTVVLFLSVLSPIFDFTGNITESFITSAEAEFQSEKADSFSVSIANMLVTDTEDPSNKEVFKSEDDYLSYDYINTKKIGDEHSYKYSYFSTWLVGIIFVIAFAILLFLTAIKLVVNIWNLVFTKIISPLVMVLKGVDDVFSKQLFQNIFKQAFGIFLLYLLLLLYVDFMNYYITTGNTYNLFQMIVLLISGGWFIFNGDQFSFVGQDVGLTRGSALAAVAAGGLAYKGSSKLVRSATSKDVNGNRTGMIGKAGSNISSGIGSTAKSANNSSFVRGVKDGFKSNKGTQGAKAYADNIRNSVNKKAANVKDGVSNKAYSSGFNVGDTGSQSLSKFSKHAKDDQSQVNNVSSTSVNDNASKIDNISSVNVNDSTPKVDVENNNVSVKDQNNISSSQTLEQKTEGNKSKVNTSSKVNEGSKTSIQEKTQTVKGKEIKNTKLSKVNNGAKTNKVTNNAKVDNKNISSRRVKSNKKGKR